MKNSPAYGQAGICGVTLLLALFDERGRTLKQVPFLAGEVSVTRRKFMRMNP
jgi:hypothetical protein